MRRGLILSTLGGALILAAGVAVAWFAGAGGEESAAPPPAGPLVRTVAPERVARPPAILTTGFLRAGAELGVTSELAGRIVEVGPDFEVGRRLAAGDLLIRLETDELEAELDRARARRGSAEAALRQAKNALARQAELADEDFASEATLEELEANVAAAETDVARAEASIRIAETRLGDATVTAPFPAIVTAERAAIGDLLSPGESVGRLIHADRAEIRAGLTERDYRTLSRSGPLEGRAVTVRAPGGAAEREARIAGVAPELAGGARTVEAVVHLADPFAGPEPFLVNALVEVSIPLPESETPLFALPTEALQTGQRLWEVTSEARLAPVEFRIVRRTEARLFVASEGLSTGTRVLLTPVQNAVEGLAVRPEGAGGA